MTVRLRGHHLLCLLTYVGEGYSPAFVANADALAARIGSGEGVRIVAGPDDLCAPRLKTEPGTHHCFTEDVARRDVEALREAGKLLGRDLKPGARLALSPETLGRMRRAFAEGRIRSACADCSWRGLCDGVARRGFAGGKLSPRPTEGGRAFSDPVGSVEGS
ncbi:DUF1284 domain-containing protein [Neomegalonema sp.]|uniref:DUF1284 domain-containing protein n=1 Tax=Neomegalonema sp. TaxID=2039713 RepID=UPI00260823F5|nr:DUF1284 domain-containing protein [Neomegalonema sp.]MDD2867564.1 DUF1284 domain-containing protein [Neomegalonema sp.]